MSSKQNTVDFILGQVRETGIVSSRKMFGEYAIYFNHKVIGFVCDDQLFIKPTEEGKAFLTDCIEECPYPGSKPYLLITGDLWDDHEWLSELFKITESSLPATKKNRYIKHHRTW